MVGTMAGGVVSVMGGVIRKPFKIVAVSPPVTALTSLNPNTAVELTLTVAANVVGDFTSTFVTEMPVRLKRC
jgi:uncharacterized protein YlxW (UPF0749 family)